jgi:hypothetical protein
MPPCSNTGPVASLPTNCARGHIPPPRRALRPTFVPPLACRAPKPSFAPPTLPRSPESRRIMSSGLVDPLHSIRVDIAHIAEPLEGRRVTLRGPPRWVRLPGRASATCRDCARQTADRTVHSLHHADPACAKQVAARMTWSPWQTGPAGRPRSGRTRLPVGGGRHNVPVPPSLEHISLPLPRLGPRL